MLLYVPTAVNLTTMAAISMERFYAVFFPLKAKLVITCRKMQIVAILLWIFCMSAAPIHFIFAMTKEPLDYSLEFCAFTIYYAADNLIYACVIPSFICSIISCISYISIGCLLRRKAKQNLRMNNVTKFEIKTCAVLCILMITYYILYMPSSFADYFKPGSLMAHIAQMVMYVNFFINPIIYWFHPSFNKEYRKIFGSRNVGRQQSDVHLHGIRESSQTIISWRAETTGIIMCETTSTVSV